MPQFDSAVCDFNVAEAQDGKHRMISIKPKGLQASRTEGQLTFELNPEFEQGDAEKLTRMLKDWITLIRFEPVS